MKKRRAMTKGLFDNEMSASDSLQVPLVFVASACCALSLLL